MSRYIKLSIMMLATLLFSLVIRSIFEQKHFIMVAQSQGSLDAIKSYEKVILFHFPFSPFTETSVKNILNLCPSFKEQEKSLYCYETLRSALIQIGSFYQPYNEVLKSINPEIARLRVRLMMNWDKNISENDFGKIYNNQLKLLNYDNAPSKIWSFISVTSLLFWIGSVIFGIYKNKIIGTVGFIFFFIMWILGLIMA